MNKLITLLFMITITILSCKKEDNNNESPVKSAKVSSVIIKDTLTGTNTTHPFNAIYELPGCYKLHAVNYEMADSVATYDILIYNTNNNNSYDCSTDIELDTVDLNLIPVNAGTHTLYFNDSTLSKDVVVL